EGLEALAEPLGRVSDREDDEDRGDALGRRGGCRGCTHARFTRAASLAPGDELERKRGPEGPLSAIGAPTLSASSRSSSYGPTSSPWSSSVPRSSSEPRSSSPRSSSGPRSSWLAAASQRSSSCCSSWPSPCVAPFRSLAVRSSGRHAFQAPPFPFAHAPPHAIPFIAAEGVVQTFDADGTLATDPLGLPR